MQRRLIVTHHAPDLDAVGAAWLLKRFDAQHYNTAKFAFVDAGSTISDEELAQLEIDPSLVTHVDTGKGEFDHHTEELANTFSSASSLVHEHVCQVHPDLKDDRALAAIVEHITHIDHFHEVDWPEPDHPRHNFSLHQLLRGIEFTDPHDDDSQMHFGMTCLDSAYASLTLHFKALEIIETKAEVFPVQAGTCLAVETRNDDTLKLAQKQGHSIAVKKDPKRDHIRIKAHPNADIDLTPLHQKITEKDSVGTWYLHPSKKMLLNSSSKSKSHHPSPLTLTEVTTMIKELYG